MQLFWRRQSLQEVCKFSFYLFIPIAASVFYANPVFMHEYIRKSSLISYPKSDSVYTIPVGEDIEKYREKKNS